MKKLSRYATEALHRIQPWTEAYGGISGMERRHPSIRRTERFLIEQGLAKEVGGLLRVTRAGRQALKTGLIPISTDASLTPGTNQSNLKEERS